MRTKLINVRETRGFSQQSFSETVGISRSHYSQIETGDKTPSLDIAIKIKKTLEYYDDGLFQNDK